MAADELDEVKADTLTDDTLTDNEPEVEDDRLNLEVNVESPSACERHVTVTVAREDIDRYLDNAYNDLMPTANVPGFRIGRAPRKLVESQFKKDVGEQIKGSLLMDSLGQISDEQDFTAIGEPDVNVDSLEIPQEGPMTFEFNIEVRPDFEMPQWKGLKLKRAVRDFTDEDVDQQLEKMLTRFGQLVPHEGPAAVGDYLTVNMVSSLDDKQLASAQELVMRIRPTLSFPDGQLEGFDKLIDGAKADDKRSAKVELTDDAPNEEVRGKTVDIEFEVLEVKKLKLPELTEDFLKEMGDFETEEKLREAIQANLQRQLEYEQQQQIRGQITASLTEAADWELPQGLLKRQSARELERSVMELRRAGFSEEEIRARENLLQQNSAASTEKGLKEHFILERIAEEANIEAEEGDFQKEIFLIAAQSGESPRRVRAQIEKRGMMDVLQNQIIERKVLELVQGEAKFKDEPFVPEPMDVEAVHLAAGGEGGSNVPDATADETDAETTEAEVS